MTHHDPTPAGGEPELLPHPVTGQRFPSPVPPGTGWPDDPASPGTEVAENAADVRRLEVLQERLYAEHSWAILVVLQAMDAAGKDSVIKHVMSGVNPQGCQVFSFKAPNAEEIDHDFMWRTTWRVPERGRIGIFNRSYYEEVLVVRVHPELLARQRIPDRFKGKDIWKERFKSIRGFERHLSNNGVLVLKFLPETRGLSAAAASPTNCTSVNPSASKRASTTYCGA